ncbi:MAG: ABC transporter ATP-binding protein [Clostridia bacterium]|nr:ABC transporter ATP-binding protein [Clostridia bacterium]
MKKIKDNCPKNKTAEDLSALKWIFGVSKGSWLFVLVYAVLSAALSFFGILTAYGTKDVVNGATLRDAVLLKHGAVFLLVLVLVQLALKVLNNNMFERAKAKIEIRIRSRVFENIIKKDYNSLSSHHSGDILNRLTSDVQVICDGVTGLVPNIVALLTKLISSVVIMVGLDPIFALIFLGGGSFIAITTRLFRNYLKNIHKDAQEADGKVRSFFQESVSSVLVIKVFNAYEQVMRKARQLQDNNYKIRIRRATISIFANTGMQMAFSLGYLFAMVLAGIRVYQGIIDIGEMTAILQLVNQIQGPLSSLAGVLPRFYGIIASAERLIELENYDDELDIHSDIGNVDGYYSKLRTIDFENITFKYNRDLIFENASVTINKGDFAAITGISGIGKSTLLKLLLGVIYPENGQITLSDGTSSRIVDKATRNLFSYVPQGNMLLSGTLYENITFMCEDKTKEDIQRAVRISCADEFVSELPDGLQTVIGERGMGLSEGQVQRIAIARAILYDAPILLLDEATSALDEATEERLLRNLRELDDRTCIIITHKPAALNVCNKEIRIDNKKIRILDTDRGESNED